MRVDGCVGGCADGRVGGCAGGRAGRCVRQPRRFLLRGLVAAVAIVSRSPPLLLPGHRVTVTSQSQPSRCC